MNIVEHIKCLHQIEQRTPKWYKARENMITASDIASVIDKNPYKSSQKLLEDKCKEQKEYTSNFATIHGNKYEDEARLIFGELYNLKTWEVGLFQHTSYSWLGGSPDGICSDGSLLEIKCPVKREICHYIPEYYYPQVQICMEICNIDKCYFIQYKPATIYQAMIMDVIEIPRSKEWFAEHFETLKTFWNKILYFREHKDELPKPKQYTRKPKEPRVVSNHFTEDTYDLSDNE
jgi:putative phage-type endonuclease